MNTPSLKEKLATKINAHKAKRVHTVSRYEGAKLVGTHTKLTEREAERLVFEWTINNSKRSCRSDTINCTWVTKMINKRALFDNLFARCYD